MSDAPIRWLHLSDFHVGKDNYGQQRLFKYLLSNIQARVEAGRGPDLVFISGDLANKGQDSEYQEFLDNFFFPLTASLGKGCEARIFAVPGNHDVNRAQAQAVQTYDVLYKVPNFLDPTGEGLSQRKYLFDRFNSYAEHEITDVGGQWLSSAQGAYTRRLEIRGVNIGILGLNTAWLSRSDEDRHQMSAGKEIIETGLESLDSHGPCDVRIVLGHHPIDWFIDEDLEPVRPLFGQHNVIYLHGHLHKNQSRLEEGGGYPFLTIQSGACFQAREDERWVNRLLWCELDYPQRQVKVEPLRWSRDGQEWALDGSAFPSRFRAPGADHWVFPLPQSQPAVTITPAAAAPGPETLVLPKGWLLLDRTFLEERRVELAPQQVISFFDGRAPRWREAMAPQIPRRQIVADICKKLKELREAGRLGVTALTGASGEGKTTVLMQVIVEMIESVPGLKVIWHHETDLALPARFVSSLAASEGAWLIASDDGDVIAKQVFEAVRALREADASNIQFLLCCRDTDWIAAQANHLRWHDYATFTEKSIRGLSLEDARSIVAAWGGYGGLGLGVLEKLDPDAAARQLFSAAKSETNSREGAFLGAMLRTRYGDGLRDHVRVLLERLQKRAGPGGRLLDSFIIIAACHAEGIFALSKVVLAEALNTSPAEVMRKAIAPLGEEAIVTTAGPYILTRHRAIAEAAISILVGAGEVDLDEIFVSLVQAAFRAFDAGYYVPDLAGWQYLSSHFFEANNQPLGIRLAQVAVDMKPAHAGGIVKLAQLYREAGQPEQAVSVFRKYSERTRRDRPYFFEWGTSEGAAGQRNLGVWLDGFALADQAHHSAPDNETATICLAGLSIALGELYENYNSREFIDACGAAAQLGLRLRPDPESRRNLGHSLLKAQENQVADMAPQVCLQQMNIGILAAWDQREDELPAWVKPADELTYDGLARLLGI